MSVRTYRVCRAVLMCCLALFTLIGCYDAANAQVPPTDRRTSRATPPPSEEPREPKAAHCRAPGQSEPPRAVTTAGADYAGRAACDQEQQLRSGARQSLHDRRHDIGHHQPRYHRGDAARHQRHGRESAVAGAWRVAGFCGKRLAPRPQRSCQCAIPHQRRHAARRRYRFRQRFRHRPDRQHVAGHRRTAGRVRLAHRRSRRYDDACRRIQQFRQCQYVRRQPRHHRAELRVRRHLRRRVPRDNGNQLSPRRAIVVELVLPRRAIFLQRPLSANDRGHRESAADAQRHPRFLAAGKRLRLHVGFRRPVDAAEPYHGHLVQYLSDTQCARRGPLSGIFGGHVQFNHAQREPDRIHPI